MPTDYQVLLDPALELTAADLSAAWAEMPDCARAGFCKPSGKRSGGFEIDLADATTVALITMSATLAKDLLVDLVKRAIDRAEERRGKKEGAEAVVELLQDVQTGLPILRVTRPARSR